MARVESRPAPKQELTPQEQKRVIAVVDRMWQRRNVPAWVVWTALYRFAAQQIWNVKPKENQ
jgi:hypothetical protein